MGASKWQGIIRMKYHFATLSAQSSTSLGAWLKMNVCSMGATTGRPPPRRALNDCFQSVFHLNGNKPKYAFLDRSGALRASRNACPSPIASNALGAKYKANSEI